jgi:hypothetical protein
MSFSFDEGVTHYKARFVKLIEEAVQATGT